MLTVAVAWLRQDTLHITRRVFLSCINLFEKKILEFNSLIVILRYTDHNTMGATKTVHFTEQQNHIANITKALGHPARIAIIEYLLKVNTCICSDIVDELPLAQSTISQHLKELKNAGLIKGNIEGTSICYCIDENTFAVLKAYFGNIILSVNNQKCC
ncbi:ArsR/SmtB family transcription factor [Sphingobacterium anhuiense]|uniref:ArsR/SmtB family transcription factor n=1 Tax=Sphingobacterium anhuiense TaxID=493780 RepID=UPI003C2E6101